MLYTPVPSVTKLMNSGDESEGSLEDILKQVEEQEKVCISTLSASITENNPQSPYRWEISVSVTLEKSLFR